MSPSTVTFLTIRVYVNKKQHDMRRICFKCYQGWAEKREANLQGILNQVWNREPPAQTTGSGLRVRLAQPVAGPKRRAAVPSRQSQQKEGEVVVDYNSLSDDAVFEDAEEEQPVYDEVLVDVEASEPDCQYLGRFKKTRVMKIEQDEPVKKLKRL